MEDLWVSREEVKAMEVHMEVIISMELADLEDIIRLVIIPVIVDMDHMVVMEAMVDMADMGAMVDMDLAMEVMADIPILDTMVINHRKDMVIRQAHPMDIRILF